jgi:hypothetical protein
MATVARTGYTALDAQDLPQFTPTPLPLGGPSEADDPNLRQRLFDVFSDYISNKSCYGVGPAQNMNIQSVLPTSAFHVTLHNFVEQRELRWEFRASPPQMIGAPSLVQGNSAVRPGLEPDMWSLDLRSLMPKSLPADSRSIIENLPVDNSQRLEICFKCTGKGRTMCGKCQHTGMMSCHGCAGSGRIHRTQQAPSHHPHSPQGQNHHHHQTTVRVTCPNCNGSGRSICTGCAGSGSVLCNSCQGSMWLLHELKIVVNWTTKITVNSFSNTALPDKIITKTATKREDDAPVLSDRVENFVDPALSNYDQILPLPLREQIAKKVTPLMPNAQSRILQQRVVIRRMPVYQVHYTVKGHNNETAYSYIVFGANLDSIFEDDYPQNCCGCCRCSIM